MPLNEADTRAQLIDPQLNVAGWTRSQVTREHYYRTDWAYTAGKIVLRGERAERLPPPLTLDDLKAGVSRIRNRVIVWVLRELGAGGGVGHGLSPRGAGVRGGRLSTICLAGVGRRAAMSLSMNL